jgi:archaellin
MSDLIDVLSTVRVDIEERTVGTVEMVVKKAPGATDVDLSRVVVEWVGP